MIESFPPSFGYYSTSPEDVDPLTGVFNGTVVPPPVSVPRLLPVPSFGYDDPTPELETEFRDFDADNFDEVAGATRNRDG